MWQHVGFLTTEANIEDAIQRLSDHIEHVPERYKKIPTGELLQKTAPGKWSKQEVLGHLIDSGINNLKRFTEVQFSPQPYEVISYEQDELVAINNYQHIPLSHLLNFWQALNRQILYIMKDTSPEKLNYPVNPKYENNELKTLGWIMCDYVAHMEHHLAQVFGKS